MRHWLRRERRFEIAFIIGPVAPTAMSNAPVRSVSGLILVGCTNLFTIQLYPTILQYFPCFNEQWTYLAHVFYRYVMSLPAHKRARCVAPLFQLRNAVR